MLRRVRSERRARSWHEVGHWRHLSAESRLSFWARSLSSGARSLSSSQDCILDAVMHRKDIFDLRDLQNVTDSVIDSDQGELATVALMRKVCTNQAADSG